MDEQFDALTNIDRRRLLIALLDHNSQGDNPIVLEDIHRGEKAFETLKMELYHIHLPRLEEAGFIRWNRYSDEVVKGPKFDEIRPLLELLRDHADELSDDWL